MSNVIKALNHGEYQYGDVVRVTQAVRNSKGKRFKFVGACFDPDDLETPIYYELIQIDKGQMRSIRPEHVVKDIPATKDARARIAAKTVAKDA